MCWDCDLDSTVPPPPREQQKAPETKKGDHKNATRYWKLVFVQFAIQLVLQILAYTLLPRALVRFAESSSKVPHQCKDRLTKYRSNFTGIFNERLPDPYFTIIGNSDFYGFGIRLGMNLQWTATIIAGILLPKEHRDLLGSYYAFGIALIVALLVLVFSHACVFTAEIIVLLYIL